MPARIAHFQSPPWVQGGVASPRIPPGRGWARSLYPDSHFKRLVTSETSNVETEFVSLGCQVRDGERPLRLGYLVKFELVGRKQRKWKNMRYSASSSL